MIKTAYKTKGKVYTRDILLCKKCFQKQAKCPTCGAETGYPVVSCFPDGSVKIGEDNETPITELREPRCEQCNKKVW